MQPILATESLQKTKALTEQDLAQLGAGTHGAAATFRNCRLAKCK
jgi:hypothetical protein